MTELFLGQSAVFWGALEAIGVSISALFVAVTGWLVYRQVRTAAKAFQLDGLRYMQDLVDGFNKERTELFGSIPIELAMETKQFPRLPPGQHAVRRYSEGEHRRMELTDRQKELLDKLSDEQLALARKVIGKLNDLGQLVEGGYIDRKAFLGKYHVMVIQLCYLLEPIRRREERSRSGNYGQRLLRMRHTALIYNTICPKHRSVDVRIHTPKEERTIVEAVDGSALQRLKWCLQRRFSMY